MLINRVKILAGLRPFKQSLNPVKGAKKPVKDWFFNHKSVTLSTPKMLYLRTL